MVNENLFRSFAVDEELEGVARKLQKDDKMMLKDDETYSGYIIPLSELNMMMNHLKNINFAEQKKRRIKSVSLKGHERSIYVNVGIPQALREILDFLKEIDNDLYLYALSLIVGQTNEKLQLFDPRARHFDINKEELKGRSVNTIKNGQRYVNVALNEHISKQVARRVRKFTSEDSCSVVEMIKILHEISHNFDRSSKRGELDKKGRFNFPNATSLYLDETTACFFETIFGDYLLRKHPEYEGMVLSDRKERIITNGRCVERTRIASALVRIKEEKGYIPQDFLENITSKGTTDGIRKDLLKEKRLFTDRKYALAQLLVPTMVKVFRQDEVKGKERIRKYLERVKDNDFDGALAVFGIDLRDKDSYNDLLKNYREWLAEYKFIKTPLMTEEEMER